MSGLIGYYVHHQGDGHRQRALSIARLAPDRFVLLGTGLRGRTEGIAQLCLDDDRPERGTTLEGLHPEECLHYVPLRHEGVRQRVAMLTRWIADNDPALIVVDVSVEIALLARLASMPTVYVRLSGTRNDPAHLQAFRGSRALMAPFHADLDNPLAPAWVRDKTFYAAGLGAVAHDVAAVKDRILLVNGAGGTDMDAAAVVAAACAMPQYHWRAIGAWTPPTYVPSNLEFRGWVANADEEIAGADIVVGSAGDGVVGAVLASGRPYICVPQSRPYAEQLVKGRRLQALGAAVLCEQFPSITDWPAVLDAARTLNPAAAAGLHDPRGPATARDFLLGIASRNH